MKISTKKHHKLREFTKITDRASGVTCLIEKGKMGRGGEMSEEKMYFKSARRYCRFCCCLALSLSLSFKSLSPSLPLLCNVRTNWTLAAFITHQTFLLLSLLGLVLFFHLWNSKQIGEDNGVRVRRIWFECWWWFFQRDLSDWKDVHDCVNTSYWQSIKVSNIESQLYSPNGHTWSSFLSVLWLNLTVCGSVLATLES